MVKMIKNKKEETVKFLYSPFSCYFFPTPNYSCAHAKTFTYIISFILIITQPCKVGKIIGPLF